MSDPYPVGALEQLQGVLDRVTYREGWRFGLEDHGLFWALGIQVDEVDSTDGRSRAAPWHHRPIPREDRTVEEWERWVLDQVILAEQHEACEFFRVDGVQVYLPDHRGDPYEIERKG